MARHQTVEAPRIRISSARDRQIRGLLNTALIFVDAAMLMLAFALGYVLRARLPLPGLSRSTRPRSPRTSP